MQTSHPCRHAGLTSAYALEALGAGEIVEAQAHIASCPECRRALENLRAVVNRLVSWPTDVLRPSASLKSRLARRIAEETGEPPLAATVEAPARPEWEAVAPGIECKLLAADRERQRISMLVRLVAGASYPAHQHAGVEELHLLDGELWIDERKLAPGDYSCGAPGARDERVFSETGCTCLLLTSTQDVLR
jgi:anti-sigma factor ChrR (cupin superfamily)